MSRVVWYDTARANYALLNEIPERLREHSRGIIDKLRGERSKLTALEHKTLLDAGIEAAEAEAARSDLLAPFRARFFKSRPSFAAPHCLRKFCLKR
jgi:hypothetical protein